MAIIWALFVRVFAGEPFPKNSQIIVTSCADIGGASGSSFGFEVRRQQYIPYPASMNRENRLLCFVFPMGMEAYPFLQRVEVRRRWRNGAAVYRQAFFEGRDLLIVRCGVGPAKAAAAIRTLPATPSAIVNVGTAGGLVEVLRRGDLIVARETVLGGDPLSVCAWPEELVEALAAACTKEQAPHRIARLATVKEAVWQREDRERLHALTGAHAVDMESHAIGLEAMKREVPFVSLRVISDDVDAPPFPEKVRLARLWRNPSQFPKGLSNWVRWRIFIGRLRAAVQLLDPVLVRFIREFGRNKPQSGRGCEAIRVKECGSVTKM
jgi:nucleoside phosphorylase